MKNLFLGDIQGAQRARGRDIRAVVTALTCVMLLSFPAMAQDKDVFELSSPAFENDHRIPDKYTCRERNLNPPLIIRNVPEGTQSLALTVFDPEGVIGPWVHWVVFNIRPDVNEIGEGDRPGVQALNDFGNFHYGGPCLADDRIHRFVFTLYALNVVLSDITEGATKDTLEQAMRGKIIAKDELVGTYQNLNWK